MLRWRGISGGERAALVAVALVGAVMFVNGDHLFSPGALNARSRTGARPGGVRSHAELANHCGACHAAPWAGRDMAARCLDCHADVRQQLDTGAPLHGRLANGGQCRTCHTEHRGAHAGLTDLGHFDHDCAAFALTGKHRSVACQSCHPGPAYQGTPQSCSSCHAEPEVHKGRYGTGCASCHATSGWKDLAFAGAGGGSFDHDCTAFPLTGKHRAADCRACHSGNTFRGTASACVSCHSEPPVPQVHQVRHGSNCAACHSTDTWTGLIYRHTFPLNHHNKGRDIACATCHSTAENYRAYTCAGCHAHEPTKMERKHRGKGLGDISDCVRCHATGRKHDHKRADQGTGLQDIGSECPGVAPRPAERTALFSLLSPIRTGCRGTDHRTASLDERGPSECFATDKSEAPPPGGGLGQSGLGPGPLPGGGDALTRWPSGRPDQINSSIGLPSLRIGTGR